MKRTLATLAGLCLLATVCQSAAAQTRSRRVTQDPTQSQPQSQPQPSQTPPTAPEEVGEGDVIRVETALVTIPVSVTDRQGRYIPDLQKEDFRIFEDGVEREVAYFASVEKPFTVVIMIDTSSSVWGKLGKIKDAAVAFVGQLRPDDSVMVVSFAGGLTVHCEPTSDREKLNKTIRGIGKGLSTHLYDSMEKLMSKHLTRFEGRKAVVLFTDGVDASSRQATYEETTQAAEELDAIIYSIRYDTYDPSADKGTQAPPPSSRRLPGILGRIPIQIGIPGTGGGSGGGSGTTRGDYALGERYLRELAELTGGRFYEADRDLRNIDETFGFIAEELRRQYSLGYYARAQGTAGERRRVRVRVGRPELAVRARDSYIYRPAESDAKVVGDKKQPPANTPVLKKPFAAVARAGRK